MDGMKSFSQRHILLSIQALGLLFIFQTSTTGADTLPTCQPKDFHYEYTECDSDGGRWRVSVPRHNVCLGGAPNPPVRGQGCDFTCEHGQYLNLEGDQECLDCPSGTYSLGGGLRFEDWDHLPSGFSVVTDSVQIHSSRLSPEQAESKVNCSSVSWTPQGRYISSLAGECGASLVYTANLVKPGRVDFTYQSTDDNTMFRFKVQNSQCQTVDDNKANRLLSTTDEGEWSIFSADLTTGMNVLYWKTMVIDTEGQMRKPILIKRIEVSGVAYTSECTKCRAGTISQSGASACEECPENSYSGKGTGECVPCASNEYSAAGSAECKPRPACTKDDYFEDNTPCDRKNMTQSVFKWIQPKICQENLEGSVSLPEDGEKVPCPPCNPGTEPHDGACRFCEPNYYSDGRSDCRQCGASTAPEVGLQYTWWNNLPKNSNLSTTCLSVNDEGCISKTGWVEGLSHIRSAKGHSDDVYLVLTLDIGGFRGEEQLIQGKPVPVGEVSFTFSSMCSDSCTFIFMKETERHGTSVIQTWSGPQPTQPFVFKVLSAEAVTFTWVFQKRSFMASREARLLIGSPSVADDAAFIYSLNVTNSIEGGASSCRVCPKGASQDGCIPCPQGHYVDTDTSVCTKCPEGTVVEGSSPWGRDSCKPCGEGLTEVDNAKCVSNCKYESSSGQKYDFSSLSGPRSVVGSHLFTSSGTPYYHLFNVSLCGEDNTFPVSCYDNISYTGDEEIVETVQSTICRMTIIPPRAGEGEEIMATQPASLGDALVNITSNASAGYIKERMEAQGFPVTDEVSQFDVHFTYLAEVPTAACKNGRSTVITMRCDTTALNNGTVDVPPRCPDGTCDGCNFHFVWRTLQACPVCHESDFTEVKEECVGGKQLVHRLPSKYCTLRDGTDMVTKTQPCSLLPFWLQLAIGIAAGVGLLLIILVVYCWKRNRRLEYKYMKLIMSSNTKDGELPAAETCALSEDEEGEIDTVDFKQGPGKKFFHKLRLMAGKDKDSGDLNMENICMDEKSLLA